jgi:hypothetical protein
MTYLAIVASCLETRVGVIEASEVDEDPHYHML